MARSDQDWREGVGVAFTIRPLLGFLPAHGGRVMLGGARLDGLARRQIARRVAYEVEEIVLMGRTARLGRFAQPGDADRDAARAALDRLGIGALATSRYTRLSGGQRQLVLIA